jgi:BRCA1-associated protein
METDTSLTNLVPFYSSGHYDDKLVSGYLELMDTIPLKQLLANNRIEASNHVLCSLSGDCTTVCLLFTPAFMIPRDIIHLFSGYLDLIKSVEVHGHSGASGAFLSIIHFNTAAAAAALVEQFHGKPLSSLGPEIAIFAGIRNIIRSVSDVTSQKPAAIQVDSKEWILKSVVVSDEAVCVLCLESLYPSDVQSSSFTMCCGHTFHARCVMKLENTQCPVCRFQHDDAGESMSCCNDCGWRGAFYEGRNEGTSSSSSQLLPDRDNDLWVCLVCGFIGCGRMHLLHIQRHYETTLHTYIMNTESRRVWDFAGKRLDFPVIVKTASFLSYCRRGLRP